MVASPRMILVSFYRRSGRWCLPSFGRCSTRGGRGRGGGLGLARRKLQDRANEQGPQGQHDNPSKFHGNLPSRRAPQEFTALSRSKRSAKKANAAGIVLTS